MRWGERAIRLIAMAAVLGLVALSWHGIATAQASPAPGNLDTIEQRVRPCAACHGKEGRVTGDGYFPRIAGKPARYLFNQLVLFREGKRNFRDLRRAHLHPQLVGK